MMAPWLAWTAGICLWLTGWLVLASRDAAVTRGDDRVARLSVLLKAFTVTTCLAVLGVPRRGIDMRLLTLWLHHAAIGMLFVFLLAAQYQQAEAWWRIRRGMSAGAVAASYRRLWLLTELVPAPVAMVILFTGLRLIWETPRLHPLAEPWLFALVVGFSLFFWDGIITYLPVTRTLRHHWAEADRRGLTVADAIAGRRPP